MKLTIVIKKREGFIMKRLGLSLVLISIFLFGALPTFAESTGEDHNRLNSRYPASPAGLYCSAQAGHMEIWQLLPGELQGSRIFRGNIADKVHTAITTRQDQVIFQRGNVALYALASNQILFTAPDPSAPFTMVFPSTVCGVLTPSQTVNPTTPTAPIAPDVLPNTSITVTVTTTTTTTTTTTSYTGEGTQYTVRTGDNLFRIGLRFGVPYQVIAAANNITDVNRIFVGQVLVIPQASTP
jgi:LysM repeat protein